MKTSVKTALSIWLVIAVCGIIHICGKDPFLFNKGIISCGVFLLTWQMAEKAGENLAQDKRRALLSYLFSLLLAFTELLGIVMWLEANVGDTRLGTASVLWLFLSALAIAVVIEPVFFRLSVFCLSSSSVPACRLGVNQLFVLFWLLLFAGFLPCALAFYPGLYCYDMVWQWAQFAAGEYSTHHPLLHTLFSGAVIELGKCITGSYEKGLFLHSLVQLWILSGSMAFGLRFLVKKRFRPSVILGVFFFFLLFPFFPVLGISTTKDTIFGCLFFIVFVCICDMLSDRKIYRGWRLAGFLLVAVLMCLFRNNALYGLAVMAGVFVLLLPLLMLKNKDVKMTLCILAITIGCILASKCMFTVLQRSLHAASGSTAEMLSVPMQQMARSYVYHQEELTPEEDALMTSFFDRDSLLRYRYYLSDPVKAGMDISFFNEHKKEFVMLWLDLFQKFPKEYVAAPLYNTFGLWYLGGDSSSYIAYEMLPPFDSEHAVEIRSKLPWLKSWYSWFTADHLQDSLPVGSLIFYTSFYSWCILLAAFVLIVNRRYSELILPLFLACYEFSLVFGPCIIIRYCFGIILCVPVLLSAVFCRRTASSH